MKQFYKTLLFIVIIMAGLASTTLFAQDSYTITSLGDKGAWDDPDTDIDESSDNFGILSIELDVMKQEVSTLEIKGSIVSQGKIALYGILFDTGKSDIRPESGKAISSVAIYLKENPEVNVYIVGHTDNVGDYAMNQKLSKSRGESVKNYLVSKYMILATRLSGDGAGPIKNYFSL